MRAVGCLADIDLLKPQPPSLWGGADPPEAVDPGPEADRQNAPPAAISGSPGDVASKLARLGGILASMAVAAVMAFVSVLWRW